MDLATMEHLATDLARAVPRGIRPLEPQPVATQAMWFTGWGSPTEPVVSSERVLGLPGAWRAVNMIANGVAAMAPPRAVMADRVTPIAVPSVAARPNALYGTTEYFHMAVAQAVVTGNFVGVLADFDVDGYARQVVPVPTRMVNAYYRDGIPVYEIGDRELGPWDVVHVRWLNIPGQVLGVGPVTAHRNALGVSLAQQSNALNLWQRNGVPPGILKVHRPKVSSESAREAREEWLEARSEGGPAVYGDEFDFEALAWSPEDSQFLESRQFSVAEIALIFGLDPSDLGASLGAGGALTYANLSTRLSARVVETLGPWLGRFEDAWSDLLPGGSLIRFTRETYAHASRRELLEELGAAIASGILTPDEARSELNLAPLEAGDATVDDAARAASIAELLQKGYLAVTAGVITIDELRHLADLAGADFGPMAELAPPPPPPTPDPTEQEAA